MLQWLNITGLGFDFFGVILLSYEWWIAMKSDEKETEIARREQMMESTMAMHRRDSPHQDVFDRMDKERRFSQRVQRATSARGMRRGYYIFALLLITSGFILQIIGSWPGLGH
jgi:hypothetical protein